MQTTKINLPVTPDVKVPEVEVTPIFCASVLKFLSCGFRSPSSLSFLNPYLKSDIVLDVIVGASLDYLLSPDSGSLVIIHF